MAIKTKNSKFCGLLSTILVLSLLVGALSVFAAGQAVNEDAPKVVRLVKNIPRGTRLNEKCLETVTLKVDENIPENVISDISKDRVYSSRFFSIPIHCEICALK